MTRTVKMLGLALVLVAGCAGNEGREGESDTSVDVMPDGTADTGADTIVDTSSEPDAATDPDVSDDTVEELVEDAVEDAVEDVDVPEGSLGPGESCTDGSQCAGEAECVSGEYTSAYCAPLCTDSTDCQDETTGMCGICADATDFRFCILFCGVGGMVAGCSFTAVCPGDLECDGAACR